MSNPQKRMIRGPLLYTTHQLNLERGDQVRITYERRTIFVYVNARGLHILRGGYSKRRKSK